MDVRQQNRLVFHGAVVILLGLLLGFPFAFVQLGTLAGSERAWRMAHLEGVLNGLLVIAFAAVGPGLRLSVRRAGVLVWALVVTAYGNVVAAGLGATYGVRGLGPGGPAVNTVVYVLFLVAILAVLVAVGLTIVGARGRARP